MIGNRAQACQTVLRANHLNFMAREDIQEEDHVFAKIRYNHKGAYCHVKRTGEDEITCNANNCPWGELKVDVVLECSGFYTSKEN